MRQREWVRQLGSFDRMADRSHLGTPFPLQSDAGGY